MRMVKAGVPVHESAGKNPDGSVAPYKIWMGDRFQCPGCGRTIVANFAREPVSEHFQENFKRLLPHCKVTI